MMFGLDDGGDSIDRRVQLVIGVDDVIIEHLNPAKFLAGGGDSEFKVSVFRSLRRRTSSSSLRVERKINKACG
jgi:predicted KAP-like P-loop ATPase